MRRKRTMEVVAIRKGLRLTQARFGLLVHAAANTVSRWERGDELKPDAWQERILAGLEFAARRLPEHTRKYMDALIDTEGAGALGLLLVTPDMPPKKKRNPQGHTQS